MTADAIRPPNVIQRLFAGTESLADVAKGRDNNFNLIRMVMASMVLVHHGFVLTGHPIASTNLLTRLVHNFGEIGVDGFFVISGFLVTRSLLSRHDVGAFVAARVLRIFPGLWVMLTVTTLAFSALTTLPAQQFLLHHETLSYVARNATAFFIAFNLPGLFEHQANNAANGSLWSLHYELMCYAGVALTGLLGIARKKWPFVLGVLACIALFVAIPEHPSYFIGLFRRLGLVFGLGAVAASFSTRIPLRFIYAVILAALGFALDSTLLAPVAWSLFYAYLLLWAAYVPRGPIRAFNRLPDISYGLYIYAFPVQQSLIATGLALTPLRNMLGAWVITATLATISWYVIEKPSLELKDRLGRQRDPRVAT
jgi:peptidoglycan/LPS O-acetylase OafA/YrhL